MFLHQKRRNLLNRRNRILVPVVLLVALFAVAGCKKKMPPPPPATIAPPVVTPAPTAQITATPTVITAGDQVVLNWRTTDATSASIDGIGDVPTSGVKTVTPTVSTSYRLVAKGAGGSADAIARVTVNALPVPTISGPSAACTGFSMTYNTQAGMTNYTWSVSAGGSVTSGGTTGSNTVTVTWNTAGAQTVSINYISEHYRSSHKLVSIAFY